MSYSVVSNCVSKPNHSEKREEDEQVSDSVLEKTAIKDKIKYLTKPAHPVLRVPLSLELIRQEGFGPSP